MQIQFKEIVQKGKDIQVPSNLIGKNVIIVTGKVIKIARIEEEFYENVEDPELIIETLDKSGLKADIFTFLQILPENKPKYNYYMESESFAAIPIKTYDYWWKSQISAKVRNKVRKAKKLGVVIKQANFDDEFIKGMQDIFNESPIRQGKPFWHYGKDFETIKRQFSINLFREELFGAYYNEDLVGFIFLAYADKIAYLTQIISKIQHRDKAPNNALIAKAMEVCFKKGISYLVYAMWTSGSLGDFKRGNGFEKIDVPRYYIPLSIKGKIVLKFKLNHGISGMLPKKLLVRLIDLRKIWYSKKYRRMKNLQNGAG